MYIHIRTHTHIRAYNVKIHCSRHLWRPKYTEIAQNRRISVQWYNWPQKTILAARELKNSVIDDFWSNNQTTTSTFLAFLNFSFSIFRFFEISVFLFRDFFEISEMTVCTISFCSAPDPVPYLIFAPAFVPLCRFLAFLGV